MGQDNNDAMHVDLTASNELVVANDSLLAVIEARNMKADKEFIIARGQMDQGLEFGRNVSGQVTGTRGNVTRPPDTEHGSQGRNAADQLSDQLTKQPWYYGEIQFQLAFELLQEHANMGDYIVLRST